MMWSRLRCGALLLAAAAVLGPAAAKGAEAQTRGEARTPAAVGRVALIGSGRVRGAEAGGVLSWKGIPYAAPPVGRNRWRFPQPPAPWNGVRDATRYGADPPQKPIGTDAAPLGATPGEDCLYVNVWRPARAAAANPPGAKLPVLVWVYGGAFVNGGASPPVYDGAAFARQGLVVVSFNYRLGRLGFFSHPALLNAKEGPVGNFGYMDQIAALKWVQRNIGAFGGDPARVTLMGESAGGISVLQMMASPQATGLFRRAVVMSGGGREPLLGHWPVADDGSGRRSAAAAGVSFARSHGIRGDDDAALAKLRALPVSKVVGDLNMELLVKALPVPDGLLTYPRGPINDGLIVTGTPEEAFADGAAKLANPVPLLIGTVSADLPALFPPLRDPLSFFGAENRDAAARAYGTTDRGRLFLGIGMDRTMQEPARFVARQMAAAGRPAWLYRFDYVAESQRSGGAKGAGHASEIPFAFATLDARYGRSKVTPKDRAASRAFHAYLANFAKYGDPNGAGGANLPAWPRVDPARSDLMLFTPDNGPVVKPDPWRARLDLVEKAAQSRR